MTQETSNTTWSIKPNDDRVIIKLLSRKDVYDSPILVEGQLKAGENLLFGEVVDGGSTRFHPGDLVYYSEYSAARMYQLGKLKRGEFKTMTELQDEKNVLYVVAADDIMAYEEMSVDTSIPF